MAGSSFGGSEEGFFSEINITPLVDVVLVLLILVGLWWAIHSGQFERIEGEAERILRED